MDVDVIIDDEPCDLMEREDRPRSHTWPILPPPAIETIHEDVCDAEVAQQTPVCEPSLSTETTKDEKSDPSPRKNSRKNAWGNLSYADLITQAIQSSPEQRLTLSQIYDWMVQNIPYFKDKGDSTSSAGWKNSIRHNLSLHSRFMRVQNDNNGKSSYWVINPDAKPGKSSRRRAGSVDGAPKPDKATKRARSKKLAQSSDDITALSPNSLRLGRQNHSCENLFSGASPCSSTDSISNMDDFHDSGTPMSSYPFAESFTRPRSTSNVSTTSSIASGQLTPIKSEVDLEDDYMRMACLDDGHMAVTSSADETANMVENMSLGQHHVRDTINLDDSLKMMGSTDNQYGYGNELIVRRGHSDSFGSGDSGYDSPSYFSPPLPQTTMPSSQMTMAQMQSSQMHNPQMSTNQQMRSMPSPVMSNVVPNKPPPPYTNHYPPSSAQLRQQAMYNQRNEMPMQTNYYNQQQVSPNGQNRHAGNANFGLDQQRAPRLNRLQHLPVNTSNYGQNVCPPSQMMSQSRPMHQQAQRQPQRSSMQPSYGSEQPYPANVSINPHVNMNNNKNPGMNMTMSAQSKNFYQHMQQQPQPNRNPSIFEQEFPSDLNMLQLQGFTDQQQLASDIDAIIKSDMGENSLEALFEGNAYPMHSHRMPTTMEPPRIQSTPSMNFMAMAGHGWVR